MEHIEKLIRGRRSVRTFDGKDLRAEDLEKLTAFMAGLEIPTGYQWNVGCWTQGSGH